MKSVQRLIPFDSSTSQVQFVDDLQMVTRLVMGIVISYGAINQMEKSERKYYWITL